MATQGLKPVAEFQFMGFIHPAMDHILNHASRMRTRTSGRLLVQLFSSPIWRRHSCSRASF